MKILKILTVFNLSCPKACLIKSNGLKSIIQKIIGSYYEKNICISGQGSQVVGMGKELFDSFAEAKEVFQEVDNALSQNLSKIIFEGPQETLTLTENAQPALMATSMAVLKVLLKQSGKDISFFADYAAGHSLGEYSALCAAGSFNISQTAKLLKLRGQSMQEAVQ